MRRLAGRSSRAHRASVCAGLQGVWGLGLGGQGLGWFRADRGLQGIEGFGKLGIRSLAGLKRDMARKGARADGCLDNAGVLEQKT